MVQIDIAFSDKQLDSNKNMRRKKLRCPTARDKKNRAEKARNLPGCVQSSDCLQCKYEMLIHMKQRGYYG